jgi:sialic acid synthase SpsE
MTYSSKQLNFNKINSLKKKYKLNVGYSCHNDNINTLYALSYYNPDCIFLYVKHSNMKRYKIPDDKHAVLLEDLEKIKKNYLECLNVHKINNEKFNINIFKK